MKKLSIKKVCRYIAIFIGIIASGVINLAWMFDGENRYKSTIGLISAIFTTICFFKAMSTKW